jgi:hypothetical protein
MLTEILTLSFKALYFYYILYIRIIPDVERQRKVSMFFLGIKPQPSS